VHLFYASLFLILEIISWLNLMSHQLHGQHQMQYSQPVGHQQFQSRQLSSGHVQHGMGQSQLNQGNQLNRHLSQFSSAANTSLFNTGQGAPNTQMVRYVDYF